MHLQEPHLCVFITQLRLQQEDLLEKPPVALEETQIHAEASFFYLPDQNGATRVLWTSREHDSWPVSALFLSSSKPDVAGSRLAMSGLT